MKRVAIALISLTLMAGCATAYRPSAAPSEPPLTTAAATPTVPAPADTATVAQQQALRKAESYLRTQAFSRQGLIDQLVFSKFAVADAAWAADHLTVDWKEQAVRKANSYLKSQAFSHGGLVDQLMFSGFTPEEAEHGAVGVGL